MMLRTPTLALSILLALAGNTHAQDAPAPPTPTPATPPPATPSAEQTETPERMREMLVRRRDAAEMFRARLDEAIARLDRGEPLDPAAFAELRESMGDRPFMRGRAGGDDEMARRPEDRRAERREGPDGGPANAPFQPGSIEETRRMRAFVDENLPLLAERLRAMEQQDPEGPRRMLGRLGPRLREAMDARQHSPELFALRVEELQQGFAVIEAARRTRAVISAEGAESPSARDAIERFRAIASDHYRTQVRLQEREVAELEARLADLRAEVQRKTESRDAEIDARVQNLIKGWPEGGPEGGRGERQRDRQRENEPDDPREPRRQRGGPQ